MSPEADVESRFLHDFEVTKVIGGGSFGTVHKVKSRLDGCFYAVKATNAQFKGQLHRDRTLKEVFALAALSARDTASDGLKHIVRYYQAWIEDERLFIQTELCDASLESRVARGVWPCISRCRSKRGVTWQPLPTGRHRLARART